jgi:hypothetical protein
MSQSDKTQQQLIDSIRKTKTAAGKSPTTGTASKTTPAAKPAAQSKPAPRAKRATTPPAAAATPSGSDPFQLGRRVWPD